jgi:hypothetical protein
MNRQDLFEEFMDPIFALAPDVAHANDPVRADDVESVRQRLVAICDRVAMRVAMDNEFTPDDAVDEALELESEIGLD